MKRKYVCLAIISCLVFFVLMRFKNLGRYYDKDNSFSIEFVNSPKYQLKKVDKYTVKEYDDEIVKDGITTKFRVISFSIDSSELCHLTDRKLKDFIWIFQNNKSCIDGEVDTDGDKYEMNQGYKYFDYYISNYDQSDGKEKGKLIIGENHFFLISVSKTMSKFSKESELESLKKYDNFLNSFRTENVKKNDNFFPGSFKINIGESFDVYPYQEWTPNHNGMGLTNGYKLFSNNITTIKNLYVEACEYTAIDSSKINFSVLMNEEHERIRENKNKVIIYENQFTYKNYKGIEIMETETSKLGIVSSRISRHLLVNKTYFKWQVDILGKDVNNEAKEFLNSFELKKLL